MANLTIPFLNPIKYHELTPVELPQYLSRSMDKYPFVETIVEWEQGIDYPQLFQTSDRIVQQVTSGFGPVNMKVVDAEGKIYLNTNFDQIVQNVRNLGEWVYEAETILNDFAKGYYFIKLSAGTSSPTFLISEPIFICDKIPDSVLLEYRHPVYYGDVLFETGISFFLRVLGRVRYKQPSSNDTIYEDQPLNETLVWSNPYDVSELLIGGSWGIPDYLIKRINRASGCSFTSYDGVRYTKNSGAKWERKSIDGYALSGWTLEVRETYAKASQVYENNTLQQGRASIIAGLDMDNFGAGGGGIIPISDTN